MARGCSIRTPIFDTHLYEVELSEKEMTKLAANIIAELIYGPCDVGGNKYLLSEVFVSHKKNVSALSVEDQKVVVRA